MKPQHQIDKIQIEPSLLNLDQPLGRFLITLFRQFEDTLLTELSLEGYNVTTADLNVLRNIEMQGTNPIRIAELAGITKQGISKQISKLEKRGFIKKISDPRDSRALLIVFTPKGKKLLRKAIGIITNIESQFAATLGGEKNLIELKFNLQKLIF